MGDTEYADGRFADSEEALAAMARYELFLQLQEEADGLTDEEYLKRLDEISGGDPSELLQGAESYGDMDMDEMARAAAVRAAEEMPVTEQDGLAAAYADGAAPAADIYAEQSRNQYGGMALEDGTGGAPAYGPADGNAESGEQGLDTDQGQLAGTEGLRADGTLDPESTDVEDPESAYGEGAYDGLSLDAGEDGASADAFRTGASAEHGDGASDEKNGQEEAPGPQSQKGGPEQDDAPYVPAAPDLEDEDVPGRQDGYFKEHSRFDVHDIFDDVAVGTGLAGAVVSYEYVPPEPAAGQQPAKAPEQQTPALSAMYREIERMDGPGRQEPEASGPSGP